MNALHPPHSSSAQHTRSARPFTFERIPAELTAQDQWIVYRLIGTKKVPCHPLTGQADNSDKDPAKWLSFAQALAIHAAGGASGIGYAFSADDPYVGLDFDNCYD